MLGMVGKHGSLIITELIEANIVVFPQLKLLMWMGKTTVLTDIHLQDIFKRHYFLHLKLINLHVR